jgi:predicted negative regulator of RcsB-dependent stress response
MEFIEYVAIGVVILVLCLFGWGLFSQTPKNENSEPYKNYCPLLKRECLGNKCSVFKQEVCTGQGHCALRDIGEIKK